MNRTVIIMLSVGGLLIAVFAYLYAVAPSFKIIEYTPSTQSGIYEFGGVQNAFGTSSGVQGGRFGWELETRKNPDNSTSFLLRRNGNVIRELTRR